MKKFAKYILGVCFAGVLVCASKVDVKAALNCTYEIIYDANGNITNGKEMLGYAKANLEALKSNYEALKKSGTATALELQQATDAIANAENIVRWWTDQVNNSGAYLNNIKGREKFEDDFINNRAALADLTTLQKAQMELDGAKEMAQGVLDRINTVKSEIDNYTKQLASHPEYQVSIDELNKKLVTLNKEYEDKLKIVNEKQAIYDNYAKTLNYSSYDRAIEDYAHAREINRVNPNWKG